MEIASKTLLGTTVTYPTEGMFQDFWHFSSILFHHTCQELDTVYSDGLKQEKPKNHVARIPQEIVDCEKNMECKVSKSSINTDTTAFEKAPLSIKLDFKQCQAEKTYS